MADGITRYTTLKQFQQGIDTLEKQLKSPDATQEMKEIARKRLPKYKAQMASLKRDAQKEIHARLDGKDYTHDPDLALLIRKYKNDSLSRADLTLYPGPSDFEKGLNEFEERFGGDNLLTTVKGAMAIAILDIVGADLLLVEGAKFLMNPATMAGIAKALSAFVVANPVAAVCLAAVAYLGAKKLFGPMVRKAQARREIAHAFSSETPSYDPEKGDKDFDEILRKYDEAHPAGTGDPTKTGPGDPTKTGPGDPTKTGPGDPTGKGDPAGTGDPTAEPETADELEEAIKKAAKERNKLVAEEKKIEKKLKTARENFQKATDALKLKKNQTNIDHYKECEKKVNDLIEEYNKASTASGNATTELKNIIDKRVTLFENDLKSTKVSYEAKDIDKFKDDLKYKCLPLKDKFKLLFADMEASYEEFVERIDLHEEVVARVEKYNTGSTPARDFVVAKMIVKYKGKVALSGDSFKTVDDVNKLSIDDKDKEIIISATNPDFNDIEAETDTTKLGEDIKTTEQDIQNLEKSYQQLLWEYSLAESQKTLTPELTQKTIEAAASLQKAQQKLQIQTQRRDNVVADKRQDLTNKAKSATAPTKDEESEAYKKFTQTFNDHVQNLLGGTKSPDRAKSYAQTLQEYVNKETANNHLTNSTLITLLNKLVQVMEELEMVKDKDSVKKKLDELGLKTNKDGKLFTGTGDFAKDMKTLMGEE